MSKIPKFIFVAAVLLLPCAVVSATEYFVSPTGSDSNSTPGTLSQPFQTVLKGMSVLRTGDVLTVEEGTYTEPINEPIGLDNSQATDWNNTITIRARPGKTVTLQPSSGDRVFTFQRAKQSYVIIDGFIIDAINTAINAIKITHVDNDVCHHVWIRNCTVKNGADQGILIGQPGPNSGGGFSRFSNLDVFDNGFRCLAGNFKFCHGIYASADNNIIENSRIHDNAGWGVHVFSEKTDKEIKNNIVRNNLVYNNGSHGVGGNLGIGNPTSGAGYPGIGLYSGPGHEAYGNIVWGNDNGFVLRYNGENSIVHDNIIYKNSDSGYAFPIDVAGANTNDSNPSDSIYNNTYVNADVPNPLPSIPAAPPTSVPTQYYVSPSGLDSNPGTSTLPFETIQRAADLLNPGDSVIVRNGVYTRNAWTHLDITRGGNSTAWVTFKSENKWGAVLDGQNSASNSHGISFSPGVSYVRVEGFEVKRFRDSGISLNLSSGNNFEITGNHVHHNGWFCDATSRTQGIYVGTVSDVVVEKNLIHDNRLLVNGENGCTPASNAFVNQSHGLYIEGTANLLVKNNIFYGHSQGWGIHVYSGHASMPRDIVIANNTFSQGNPVRDGQIVLTYPGVTNAQIINNIFYRPTAAGVRISATDAGATTFSNVRIQNNLTFGGVINSGTAAGVTLTGNINNTDPSFVSPSTYDFRLRSTSTAINAGAVVSQVTDDWNGLSRPQGSGIDLGAWEFDPANPPSILPVVPPSNPTGQDWYVSPTGAPTNTGTIGSPWDLQTALNGASNKIKPGNQIWLRGGTYSPGTSANSLWTVNLSGAAGELISWRSYPGEWAKIDRPWRFGTSDFHRFRELEFYDSFKGRYVNPSYPKGPWLHFDGPLAVPSNNEWINVVVHDVCNAWSGGTAGASIRGSIIWYVGLTKYDHVSYPGGKSFTGNIVGWYTSEVINLSVGTMEIKSNIMFGGGQPIQGTMAGDLLITGRNTTITNNYFYNRFPMDVGYDAITLAPDAPGATAVIRNNVIIAVPPLRTWASLASVDFQDNTLHMMSSFQPYPIFHRFSTDGLWTVNNNRYSSEPNQPVIFEDRRADGSGDRFTFSQWKMARPGFDTTSTSVNSTLPPDSIYVIPNQDDANRTHIAIYNFTRKNAVSVNVSSVLKVGEKYSLYSAQNYLAGPIQTGTLSGTSLSIPMTGLSVAPYLYGTDWANSTPDCPKPTQPPPTSPEFGAFVLVKTEGTFTTTLPVIPAPPDDDLPSSPDVVASNLDTLIGISSVISRENKEARFDLTLSASAQVTARLFNTKGEYLMEIKNEEVRASQLESLVWNGLLKNGEEAASGIYLLKVKFGNREESKKIAVVR